ncbi:MAG TPA: putative porin [Hanamia sp.]|nr:putative porin [Hanamia sp.]
MAISQKIFQVKFILPKIILLVVTLSCFQFAKAQLPNLRSGNPLGGFRNMGSGGNSNSDTIAFQHRDDLKDSITIYYFHLNSLVKEYLDSSLNDYGKFYTVPAGYKTLGNNGNAAYPILFTPLLKAGFDAGFHAFDLYKYTLENTRFYQTTKPYTQIGYFLASGKEQVVRVLQTQNIKPDWNIGFDYQLINSPGLFQGQNTNHNSYRLFSDYRGKRKRYGAFLVLLGNKLNSAENGGIQADSFLQNSDFKKSRLGIPVNLGGNDPQQNIFSNKISTGNLYTNFTAFFRQSYDVGKKDSIIVNDSTTNYLFYPRLRFQHTITYRSSKYQYEDVLNDRTSSLADSAFYKQHYDTSVQITPKGLNFLVRDRWKFISNDFALISFPDTKNLGQFLQAGLRLENFSGYFESGKKNFFNIVLHGEYRNKTRNRKWDANLHGQLYTAGYNAGDFDAYASLERTLNSKLGDVQVIFQNVNRSPSYVYNGNSSFDFDKNSFTKKENITVLTAIADNPHFTLMARNISIANYTYFRDFYHTDQFNGLVNITQVSASTHAKIVGHLNLYSDFMLQQNAGNNPIRVPLFYTRQRLAFEGNFFKNLNLSTGIDVNYNTPYKAYNYSPVMGQFFPQDSVTISNLPQVNAFFNFRIKSFTAFIKAENLNTVSIHPSFGWTNNNFAAPLYPIPGLIIRFGIKWAFVN